jgi:hypothetical protein
MSFLESEGKQGEVEEEEEEHKSNASLFNQPWRHMGSSFTN